MILSSAKLLLEQLVVLGFRITSLVVLATFFSLALTKIPHKKQGGGFIPHAGLDVGRGAGGCWSHCTHSQEAEMSRLSDPRGSIS